MTSRRCLVAVVAAVALLAPAGAFAQFGHPMKGQWSGTRTVAGQESRLLLNLEWDGKAITGVINPGPGAATVKSVANGVIGVAFVQALLVGVGFFAIGMPGAGLASLLAMALGVVQIPVIIVVLPAILYAFAVKSTTVAIIFTVWSIIGGLSDAVLKPLMIGHGLEVPMPIILLGVIGGVMAFGLVGLFIGAVVLAVGYVLFSDWVGAPATGTESKELPSKGGTLQAAE